MARGSGLKKEKPRTSLYFVYQRYGRTGRDRSRVAVAPRIKEPNHS